MCLVRECYIHYTIPPTSLQYRSIYTLKLLISFATIGSEIDKKMVSLFVQTVLRTVAKIKKNLVVKHSKLTRRCYINSGATCHSRTDGAVTDITEAKTRRHHSCFSLFINEMAGCDQCEINSNLRNEKPSFRVSSI